MVQIISLYGEEGVVSERQGETCEGNTLPLL